MFTGLIAEVGTVAALEPGATGATLTIRADLVDQLQEGDSIAVDGVCLTVAGLGEGCFQAEAVPETLGRSTLGGLRAGAPVNLELPLRVDGRLGGHIVQGHVDGVGSVSAIAEQGAAGDRPVRVLEVETDARLMRYLVEKGSIAVNGVSLTVSALRGDCFEVSLIPETLRRTSLGTVALGDPINLEVDVLAKHVERLLGAADERSVPGLAGRT